MNLPLNVVLFQIGWFACVLGAMFGAVGGPLAYYAGEKIRRVHVCRFQIGWYRTVVSSALPCFGARRQDRWITDAASKIRRVRRAAGLALGTQAVGWALLMPLMLRVAQRLDGFGAARKVELCSS